jgi:hypothetical protein
MSKHLTGEPKAFTGNQPRRWRVERCHACNRLVYACRSELDKNGKHYHRQCFPKVGATIIRPSRQGVTVLCDGIAQP